MSTVAQSIFVNIAEKRLQKSDIDGGELLIGSLFKYQDLPLTVCLVEESTTSSLPFYERKSVNGVSLRISLNDTLDDASPLCQQATWTADASTNTFSGTLSLNTAGMNSYVGSASSVTAYFQIEFSQGGAGWTPIFQQQVTVKNSVTQPTTTQPDPVERYYTAQEADGLFLTPIMRQGLQLVAISPSGNWQRVWGVDDNGTAIDQVLPYP